MDVFRNECNGEPQNVYKTRGSSQGAQCLGGGSPQGARGSRNAGVWSAGRQPAGDQTKKKTTNHQTSSHKPFPKMSNGENANQYVSVNSPVNADYYA